MNDFRTYLQQELIARTDKNPSYSLRAYAKNLKINHATLSSILAGKRTLTVKTAMSIAQALNLSPDEVKALVNPIKNVPTGAQQNGSYHILQADTFAAMSEWYFDAILEMILIPKFKIEPRVISKALGITVVQAKKALITLERLNLIAKDKKERYRLEHANSDNCLDTNFTSAANRRYQKSILKKSIEALEILDREQRDHTSTTLAIDYNDIPKVKEMIRNFRREVDAFTHRPQAKLNHVYQIQVSFFPLTTQDKQDLNT